MSDSNQGWPEALTSALEECFRAGPPLTEAQQIGRAPTIEGLASRMLRGEVKKLYEARRVGKTTVARGALRRVRAAGGVDAEVNLAIHSDPEVVAAELASQLAAGMTAAEELRSGLRRVAGTLMPARRQLGDEATAILDVMDRLLANTKSPAHVLVNAGEHARCKLAVFLDEAHVIADWPATEQDALGAALRNLTNLGVVIASSERRALELLSGEGKPLQYVGDRFTLPDIAEADWRSELARRFARIGAPIVPAALDYLLETAKGHPYCTMLLARESAISALSAAGYGALCSEAHVEAGLLAARRDEAWQDLI